MIILFGTLLLSSFAYCCQPPNQNNAANADSQDVKKLKAEIQELRTELAYYCGPAALSNSRKEMTRMLAELRLLEDQLKTINITNKANKQEGSPQ